MTIIYDVLCADRLAVRQRQTLKSAVGSRPMSCRRVAWASDTDTRPSTVSDETLDQSQPLQADINQPPLKEQLEPTDDSSNEQLSTPDDLQEQQDDDVVPWDKRVLFVTDCNEEAMSPISQADEDMRDPDDIDSST